MAEDRLRNGIFMSLEKPPTPAEIGLALGSGVQLFDFDLEQAGAGAAVRAIKQASRQTSLQTNLQAGLRASKLAGGTISAYHIGGGGGRAWGSVKAGEFVRIFRKKPALDQLTLDVKRLVAMGADNIHFDNTHRMSGRTLGKVTRAIVAGGAKLVCKNNPEKWNLVLKRNPEYIQHYAYAAIEGAIGDRWETQQSAKLAKQGLPVYIIAFRKGFDKGSRTVTPSRAQAFVARNPWARVILMADEAAYDTRTALVFG